MVIAAALLLQGCSGIQSALDPAGRAAERISTLFWWMSGGAVAIWAVVIGTSVYATYVRPRAHERDTANWLIIGGGVIFPTVVLAALLAFGLAMLPDLVATAPAGSRVIDVSGEQFWWRVRYEMPDGRAVELANEIRLPVGEHAQFRLHSPDVIHSFWIPSLAGKQDMIPGRVTRQAVEPTRTGIFRGACAEYCGGSHALMNFYTIVEDRAAFERWMERQSAPAQLPASPLGARGQELFIANGCGACHTIRGTPARGHVGPDLTHVGSRYSLGAGILPNTTRDFVRFISETERIKPGVHMPPFGMLSADDLLALATYLDGLE